MAFSKEAWETQRQQLEKTNFKGMVFWKPKAEGRYTIRYFLSPNSTNQYPFVLVFTHWIPFSDGVKPVICTELSEYGEKKPCPICKKRKELLGTNLIESVELAKQIRPSRAYLQWGFVKESTSEAFDPNPKLIGLPKTPIEQIVATMTAYDDDEEEARPNIFDLKTGKVVLLSKSSENNFAKYTATVSGKTMPINIEPWESKVKETKDIMSSLPIPTELDITQALDAIDIATGSFDTSSNGVGTAVESTNEAEGQAHTTLGSALNAIDES